ncbi:efflux RND transporter periplasmic adaptor subunit [Thioclava sp. BHET1]|nr:efflux RND transporter periplasmic adaptor subunit [Thioclava sp. BHET1]
MPRPVGAKPAPRALGMACLLAVTLSAGGAVAQAQQSPVQVNVVVLHPQDVAITANLPARVSAALRSEVRPQVSGIILERAFTEGREVKKGDLLYQIDPALYQAAYDSAQAALQQAEAAVPNAQSVVNRYQTLAKNSNVSQQDLDSAIATLAQDKAAVAVAKANVETARINLAFTKITAPITGRIGQSNLTPGALVTSGQSDALATIVQLDPINVDVTESSTNLLDLRQAIQAGRIKLSGPNVKVKLILDNGETYDQTGTIQFADPQVSETTSTVSLRANFPNPDNLLLPGMYVRAVVEQGVAPNSFLIPQRAVTRDPQGDAVALFVDKENKVAQRTLDVGQHVGNNWLVKSGVKDGDRVIVEGSQFVRAGQVVNPVEVTVDDATDQLVKQGQAGATGAAAAKN